ncbi:MAG TPA: sigma-70 family RNA polymerase sigma factor [Steroidobacteraceae bacterium]|nr:sigma-70 family RNA polymerase sigma factor [Steroidobacteraceae bacterium]
MPCAPTGERHMAAAGGLEQLSLARAQAGELEAFRQLVRAHQGAVYSLALRLLGVREDAQELSQDVFLLLHRHLPAIVSVPHLRFWLRRTACHRAIDRLRQRRSRLVALPLDAAAEIEAPALDGDLLLERRLRQLVAQLPAMPRAVLLLRYQEDMDPLQIARALELPLNTVKSHLRRSLALLRRHGGELNPADSAKVDT